jgi:hypothetical protein
MKAVNGSPYDYDRRVPLVFWGPPEPVSVFQRLQASIGLNWEDSLELRAQRIRNYGPLDDEAANALDRLSETLSDHFHRMRQDLGNPGTRHDA